MPFPIRHLPMVQNWDCQACGHCCTDYWVPVTDEERRRIDDQGWAERPEFKGKRLFVKFGRWGKRKYRLNQQNGGRCIFLTDEGRCRIHAEFGGAAKPLACQLYPYVLVPTGDHWRVSLRFACPTVAANKGRPVAAQAEDLRNMAREFEQWQVPGRRKFEQIDLLPPPPLQGRQRAGWPDLEHFVYAFLRLLRDRNDSIARRMLKCLALVRLCRDANFDKITGPRLREFLDLLLPVVNAEVPRDLTRLAPPGWIGRMLFRASLGLYLRKDQGSRRGVSAKGRIALMLAAWRLTRGAGRIPQLQIGLPEKSFADLEAPAGPAPAEAELTLERYYTIKVESIQFCGPMYFDIPFWEGFESLALTLPIIHWLARGYPELGRLEAVARALTIVDEHFGYNPFLGKSRQRFGVRILMFRREMDRLIAWYSR